VFAASAPWDTRTVDSIDPGAADGLGGSATRPQWSWSCIGVIFCRQQQQQGPLSQYAPGYTAQRPPVSLADHLAAVGEAICLVCVLDAPSAHPTNAVFLDLADIDGPSASVHKAGDRTRRISP
jgi:hypothetical protein